MSPEPKLELITQKKSLKAECFASYSTFGSSKVNLQCEREVLYWDKTLSGL